MKFTLASFQPKAIVPVWGTSNYVLHIPNLVHIEELLKRLLVVLMGLP